MASPEVEDVEGTFGSDSARADDDGALARLREWLLVDGDRLYVAGALAVAVFVLLLALNWVGFVAFVNDDSVTRVAGGMVAGTMSLVTLVVSVNQLILSREFKSAGETRDRLDGIMEFREDVEESTAVPATPAAPTRLLELLVTDIDERVRGLPDAVGDPPDEEFGTLLRAYVDQVEESTARLEDTLEAAESGPFGALSAAVHYDEAGKLHAARHLRNRYAESLPEEALAEFDGLVDALERFIVAREQFKTTYMQRELTRFSQLTVWYGIPAVLAAVLVGVVYAGGGGATLNLDVVPYVTIALVTVVSLPLALLASYVLRAATVTRRTAATGPMLPQKNPEQEPFDVEYGQREGGR
jgi:hypothetical protein